MFEDLRSDAVGLAINALRAKVGWDDLKHSLREALFSSLDAHGYATAAVNPGRYWMTGGIGFSYLYCVPANKRGTLRSNAGKLVRLVYFASRKDHFEMRFKPVDESQQGRCLKDLVEAGADGHLDPRRYYHLLRGEPGYKLESGNLNEFRGSDGNLPTAG
jgi:hypothetical protein